MVSKVTRRATNTTTIKTITTKTSSLRVPLKSAVCVGCARDGAGEIPTGAGAGDCMNDLGGVCGGGGNNTAGGLAGDRTAF